MEIFHRAYIMFETSSYLSVEGDQRGNLAGEKGARIIIEIAFMRHLIKYRI